MENILNIIQIVTSVILVFLIVIQAKGTGLGGSMAKITSVYSTKRGVEKFIFYLTIAIAILFFVSSFIQLIF